jgi:inner membrane protein
VGREQNVIGPVLGIPYQYKFKTVKEIPAPDGKVERREVEETATANAYFLPETLNISGSVQTQKLHRGIYEAVVYRAQTVLSGKFAPPDFGPLKIDLKDVQWKDALRLRLFAPRQRQNSHSLPSFQLASVSALTAKAASQRRTRRNNHALVSSRCMKWILNPLMLQGAARSRLGSVLSVAPNRSS